MSTITSDQAKASISAELDRIAREPGAFPAAMAARATMASQYSLGNQLLIMAQTGDIDVLADRVMPRSAWRDLGYTPNGQPVGIWSKPFTAWREADGTVSFKKEQAGDDAREFRAFRIVPTYPASRVVDAQVQDARQRPEPRTGEPGAIFDALAGWLTGRGWTVEVGNVQDAGGYTAHGAGLVKVDGRYSGWDRVRVLVHEAAHALLHGPEDPRPYEGDHRGDMEAEADGVAYAVLTAYGQHEAAARAVSYVAGWASGDGERVKGALDRAAAALDAIMGAINGEPVEVKAPKTSKADNRALAAWLRDNGIEPRGDVWAAVKTGERDLGKLAALAA